MDGFVVGIIGLLAGSAGLGLAIRGLHRIERLQKNNEALIIALRSDLDEEGKKVVEARYADEALCTCAFHHGEDADAWHCPRHGIQIARLP